MIATWEGGLVSVIATRLAWIILDAVKELAFVEQYMRQLVAFRGSRSYL